MRNHLVLIPAVIAALLVTMVPAATSLPSCGGREPTIVGTAGDDVLRGTPGPDVIFAGGGDDTVYAGRGDDLVCAGPGDDVVFAGGGDDWVRGQDGDDRLYGGPGRDEMDGGRGNDLLEGRGGSDYLVGGSGADRLLGGARGDVLRGSSGDDTLEGGGGADDLAGGPGADRLFGVLAVDTVADAGTADAAADTWWYPSLTLRPVAGTHVVFPNWVSGYDQHHTHAVTVTYAPGGLVLVERLSPEEYLLGLGEMPYSWAPAALRAQAIAARTYLANTLANPPRGVMAEFGFDICASSLCQLYLGAGRAQVAEDGDRWAEAVGATASRILLYQGAPALAVYHSTAGATTRSAEDVWGGSPLPYLQAVSVPAQDSPFAEWGFQLGLDEFLAILEQAGIGFGSPVGSITTTVTPPGGGPYRVRFETADGPVEVTAGRIQSAMNTYGPVLYGSLLPAVRPDGKRYPQTILSPTFTVETAADDAGTVLVRGQGWGHQVGMPQYGAQAMALAGASTGRILNHFFTGLWPRTDPGFLPEAIDVGLAWDRSEVTLVAQRYVLRSPEGVVARGSDATFLLAAGEGGMVVLTNP